MKIKSFIFTLNIIIVFILTIFLYSLYNEQQSKLINITINTVKKDLHDTSYLATKFLNKNNQIYILRPILDRKVAKNNLIKGFILAKNNKKLFVAGDVNLKIPTQDNVKYNINNITLNDLLTKDAFLIPINFYIQDKKQTYQLYIFLDKNKLQDMFQNLRNKYLLLYFLIITIIFLILHYLVQYYLINPLLKIKNFAKRKEYEPKNTLIKELNEIKDALVISFKKLDDTIDNLYKSTITDHLTRLGNKRLLVKEVEKLIKNNEKFCLVFIDLDNFKEINDFYGHSIGDELIIEISETLKHFVSKDEIITRIGGDEFILVLKECNYIEKTNHRLHQLLALLEQKWIVRNQELMTSASIGVTIYPNDGMNFDELLKNADIAMYEAKKKGKNKFVIFDSDVKQNIDKMFLLKNKLQKAIENNEFELYFQPKLNTDQKVIGCEALIRWNSDEGIISPGIFIPIAEKSGLIYEIGKWVIKETFKQIKEWRQDPILQNISIAFNVSVVQMRHEGFLSDIKENLEIFHPKLSNLEMEITESVFIENKARALHLLNIIKDIGFKISLDDFGTGYSSLSVLKEFQIDVLKIDKSFVDEVTNEQGKVYVKTIIDMAKNLHIKTVAEGVETIEQVNILKELGVDIFQGYYFAKPLKKEEFEKFVRNNLS